MNNSQEYMYVSAKKTLNVQIYIMEGSGLYNDIN